MLILLSESGRQDSTIQSEPHFFFSLSAQSANAYSSNRTHLLEGHIKWKLNQCVEIRVIKALRVGCGFNEYYNI